MRPRRYRLEITTHASGDGSATTPQINGRLVSGIGRSGAALDCWLRGLFWRQFHDHLSKS